MISMFLLVVFFGSEHKQKSVPTIVYKDNELSGNFFLLWKLQFLELFALETFSMEPCEFFWKVFY